MKRSAISFAIISLLLVAFSNVRADDFLIKTGDTLGITVLDEQDLTKRVLVDPDGTITMPLINQVKVAGLTLSQATKDVTKQLSKYIKKPQITIELIEPVKIMVTVSGEVKVPNIYPVATGALLMDAITQAGGYTTASDLSRVSITHSGGSGTAVVDLNKFLTGGDSGMNVKLSPGDTILVPAKETGVVGSISVQGAVKQPGERPLTKGITVSEALMSAGGPSEAADTSRINIRHLGASEPTPVNYSAIMAGDKTANLELQPGDVVFVEARTTLGFYTIQGGVSTPGKYELKSGTNLTQAIALAGGAKLGRLNNVRVVRNKSGVTETLQADVKGILEGKATDVPIQDGDSIYVPPTKGGVDLLKAASVLISLGWVLAR